MNRKLVLWTMLFACCTLFSAQSALACSCAPQPSPQEALGKAAAVFTGTVTSIQPSESPLGYLVTFRVESAWKGAKCREVTVFTGQGDFDCGYPFQSGQSYLVYANRSKGQLSTNICERTRPTGEASEDLTALGAPAEQCGSGQ